MKCGACGTDGGIGGVFYSHILRMHVCGHHYDEEMSKRYGARPQIFGSDLTSEAALA